MKQSIPGAATNIIRDLWTGLLDLVYPPHCLACGRSDPGYLCPKCLDKIDCINHPYCHRCGAQLDDKPCWECVAREFAFQSAYSAGVYEDALREAIHQLKYSFHLPIARPLAELMANQYKLSHLPGKADIVVPVPIHRSRQLERGFNQSTELARIFCSLTGLHLETAALIKSKQTKHQVELTADERAINLIDAFKVTAPERIAGRRILLVDDVFTTGSTLHEAATALKTSGATQIHALTLARSL